jgi:outer membrane receptor protein involved in Fe transport
MIMGGKEHLLFKYGLLVCLSLCLILPGIALGQEGEEEELEFMLEDIIVTAEKREVELQKIPMDITVVRPNDMRMYNINQVYDLQQILPDVSAQAQVGTNVLISIREVETKLFNAMYETTVATHLDGIQLTRSGGMENFFFDLERVEVLKGPQGTLYGRGSTAGSINMITRKPILGDFSGNASIEAGNYSRYRADWALNFPMGDKMAMRISGRRNQFDGYSDSGYGDADSWSNRVSWRWEPNDRLTIDLMGDYIERFENGYSMYVDEGYHLTTYGGIEIVAQTSEDVVDPRFQSGGPVYAPFESRWAFGDALDANYNDMNQHGFQATAAYEFDFATATVEYGYRSQFEHKDFIWGGAYLYPHPYSGANPVGDPPYTQVAVRVRNAILFTNPEINTYTNTMEVRLTSNTTIPAGDPLEWIIGVMGQRDAVTNYVLMPFWGYFAQTKTETEGAFAQASWMPIDKWNFTGGVRQNWDKKDYWGTNSFPFVPGIGPDPSPENYFRTSNKWSKVTYRANISYFPTDDIMPYLTYSKGYRSGNVDFAGRSIPPENLNAWELGLKSRFLDNRLQFNAGLYYYDYENYNGYTSVYKCWEDDDDDATHTPGDHVCDDVGSQADPYTGPGTGTPDSAVNMYDYEWQVSWVGYSPGGAIQKGVSVNVEYLPTYDDRMSLSATWRNNKYEDYDARAVLLAEYPDADSPYVNQTDQSGMEFGGAPIRGNMAYTHTFRFGSGDTLMATGTVFYEGEGIDIYVNQGFPEEYVMPGRDDYWTASLSFMYSSSRWMPPGNLWSIRASAQNIFDSDALSSITYTDDMGFGGAKEVYPLGSGIMTGRYINPRTYSVTFQVNF